MRPGMICVSLTRGILTVWVTTELAEKLNRPRFFFNSANEILIKNDGPSERKWSLNSKALREGQAMMQISGKNIKGQLPREFGKTDALECRSNVPGHYILKLPSAKASYKPRGSWKTAKTKAKEAAHKPIQQSAEKAFEHATQQEVIADTPPRPRLPAPTEQPEDTLASTINWNQMSLTQQFREALEIVNKVKLHFGDNLDIKILEDGTIKASLLMEF